MKKKVLLMGKSGSGKTSMRSIIFANYIARDTRRLGATIDVEHSHVRFLGNLVLNLWDCGGQEAFMENYFTSQRDHIFRNVEVLIYVFDVESREMEKDMSYYLTCVQAMFQHSRNARIFVLIHKMDLVGSNSTGDSSAVLDERNRVFTNMKREIETRTRSIWTDGLQLECFGTSIWDETLYKAWSSIVTALIPNLTRLEQQLMNFAKLSEATEVVLFERATFLVIAHVNGSETVSNDRDQHAPPPPPDVHRFEKISNIVKQFKLSCSKIQAQFQSLECRNSQYAAYMDALTANTYVLIILSDSSIPSALIRMNIQTARAHFEKLELSPSTVSGGASPATLRHQ